MESHRRARYRDGHGARRPGARPGDSVTPPDGHARARPPRVPARAGSPGAVVGKHNRESRYHCGLRSGESGCKGLEV
eukprot:766301-Hanusia_phi.AAC.2